MKKMILLFSHKLTEEQFNDAKESLKVEEFVYLPNDLQQLWSNIPPTLKTLDKYLDSLKKFVLANSKPDDIILIQGDFGGVYEMVNFSKKNNLIPVHSTTVRDSEEKTIDGKVTKISKFEHIIYRRY
ncbi:MAG: CRISPR-associated protein Csx20 [Campylobacterota bacterium]|nr:CRISPR-associated protein Csx20 [Campylobacterota bacterium]